MNNTRFHIIRFNCCKLTTLILLQQRADERFVLIREYKNLFWNLWKIIPKQSADTGWVYLIFYANFKFSTADNSVTNNNDCSLPLSKILTGKWGLRFYPVCTLVTSTKKILLRDPSVKLSDLSTRYSEDCPVRARLGKKISIVLRKSYWVLYCCYWSIFANFFTRSIRWLPYFWWISNY
jgi:hypothetical protein